MNPRPQTLVCLLLMLLVASCAVGTDGNTMTKDQARKEVHARVDKFRGPIADEMREHGWTVHDDSPFNALRATTSPGP